MGYVDGMKNKHEQTMASFSASQAGGSPEALCGDSLRISTEVDSLRAQLAQSSARLQEQLGHAVDVAQGTLKRSFAEEQRGTAESVSRELKVRDQGLEKLSTRIQAC